MLDEIGLWFPTRLSDACVVKGTVETAAYVCPTPGTRVTPSDGLFERYFFVTLITDSHDRPRSALYDTRRALRFFSSPAGPLVTFFTPDLLIPLRAVN